MSLVGDLDNTEAELQKCQGDTSSLASSSLGDDRHLETGKMDEDEEDEDIDFNPLFSGESPSEASSSLSSEDEISGETAKNHPKDKDQIPNRRRNRGNQYSEVETESTHFSIANEEVHVIPKPYKKRPFASNPAEAGAVNTSKLYAQADGLDDEDNANKELVIYRNTNKALAHVSISSQKLRIENEDAIFRRTRARHSLADYTLEELETFLQESDDDDSAHNVDDEEEYKKFLTAVLRGGDNDGKEDQEDGNIDEDEENDADFEIEIEEALESDVDENVENDKYTKRDLGLNNHVPETRQKRSQKNKKMLVNGSSIRLRPLLPSTIDSQSISFPSISLESTSFTNFQSSTSLLPSTWTSTVDASQGFSATQIGQLYCLLHEHVQLLIQLFSICILDPSWHHIANSFKKMIIELTEKREEALTGSQRAYPASCFDNLHLYLSEKTACNQASDCCPCVPSVRNPIMSILDVAALSLAREYMSDVSIAVSKHRSCQIEADSDKSHLIKQALFPLPKCIFANEPPDDGKEGATLDYGVRRLASSQSKQKKSLAAELIENAKKQPISQVPRGIADLVQRFLPIFNSAFFPRKPPSPAISKRIYFTESEDRLLAMGLLEYNNDWAEIQQHFLPSKSRHQIFVRQKNRSSAKAPENPIKTVRRMKTSPLTANEMTLVSMGLKMFQNDWTAVWKFLVPHRDPSLLARQWRIARGAQKSYRKSDVEKERKRIYESKRRKRKSIECKQTTGKEVNDSSANDNINEDDDAQFHQACPVEPDPRSSKTTQTITSQVGMVPYHPYNASALKVIKLAPDLPPVNLPPSVRVISQSAFQSYHGVPLACMVNHESSKIGNNIMESNGYNDVPSNNCHRNGPVLDSNRKADHPSVGDRQLPFSQSESGCVPDYANTSATTSSTQNFKPHSSQYNHGNLRSEGTGDVNQKEPPKDIQTIDFHPILQRSEDLDGDSGSVFSNNNISVPFTGPCEKENGIDLDIHLSSMNKEKTRTSVIITDQLFGSRYRSLVVPEQGRNESRTHRAPSFTKKYNNAIIMSDNSIVGNKEYAAGPTAASLQGHSARVDREKNTTDAFLADIVMEQEELSDSDDDAEHVEFEYEEMDDSEEELLNCEPSQYEDLPTCQENGGNLAVKMDASKKNRRVGSSSSLNEPFAGCTLQMSSCFSKSTSSKSKQKAVIRIPYQASKIGGSSQLRQRKVHTDKGPRVRSSRVTKNSN